MVWIGLAVEVVDTGLVAGWSSQMASYKAVQELSSHPVFTLLIVTQSSSGVALSGCIGAQLA